MGVVFVLIIVGSGWFVNFQARRRAGLFNEKTALLRGIAAFFETGAIPENADSTVQVFLVTNKVLLANGDYCCVLGARETDPDLASGGNGFLGITSNRLFVWFGERHPPILLDDKN